MNNPLEILYQDDYLVAINKPNGMFVHRTRLDPEASEFALQLLKAQIGQKVYPVHRLDRKTSGVLLFALSKDMDGKMQTQFAERKIKKVYQALVRGYAEAEGVIDYPLFNDDGKEQEALTRYKTLEQFELAVPFGKHPTSRYSLVELYPETGRMHQLRKHMAHILHPIINDRPHGCNKQNKLFKEKWGSMRMYLHATSLEFTHPISNQIVKIESTLPKDFVEVFENWNREKLL